MRNSVDSLVKMLVTMSLVLMVGLTSGQEVMKVRDCKGISEPT